MSCPFCPRVRRPFGGVRVLSRRGHLAQVHPAETRAASCPFAPESAAHSAACASCPAGATRHRTTRPKCRQPAALLPQSPPPIRRRARPVLPGSPGTGPPGRNAGSQLPFCPRVSRPFGGVRVLSCRGHPAQDHPAEMQAASCPFAPESAAHSAACASCPAGATRPKRGQPAVHLPQSPPPIQRRARLVPPGPPGMGSVKAEDLLAQTIDLQSEPAAGRVWGIQHFAEQSPGKQRVVFGIVPRHLLPKRAL